MLRSLSKVASTASAAATAAVVSVSSAAAHAEFPMKSYRDNTHSRLAKPYPGPQHIDDDYDFCQEETYGAFVGGVPSQEEVDEATRDLQATFIQNECPKSSVAVKSETYEDEATVDDDADCLVCKDSCADEHQLSTPTTAVTESPSEMFKRSPPVERNSHSQALSMGGTNSVVARCIDLLQRDPDIQAAVVSLARDPAIWDAFVKNEKVQELLQARNLRLPKLEGATREFEDVLPGKNHDNPFVIALLFVRNIVWEMMDTLVDMVGNVFGFFDQKIFGGKDSDPMDKPFKACMVLTILILALVVLKRV